MTDDKRQRLPDRRSGETVSFMHNGVPYELSAGRFRDGRIAEVFVQCHSHQNGSEMVATAIDASAVLSIALQYGAPAETLRGTVNRLADGAPASVVGRVLDELCEMYPPREADHAL